MSTESQVDPDLANLIGKPTGKSRVVLERGPVAYFALAVGDKSPTYQDTRAAEAAGLPGIPVPIVATRRAVLKSFIKAIRTERAVQWRGKRSKLAHHGNYGGRSGVRHHWVAWTPSSPVSLLQV